METKTFTVVDTRSNNIVKFESNASTLGEVKQEMRNHGIDPSGMTIQEGLTKIEFMGDDNAVLPHDVPYRGTVTNNLVFRLTLPEKRIRSGMDRKEAYSIIKEQGLAPQVLKKFGKSYTNVSTESLVEFLSKKAKKNTQSTQENCCKCDIIVDVLTSLLDRLVDYEYIDYEDGEELKAQLHGEKEDLPDVYTADEIASMFENM